MKKYNDKERSKKWSENMRRINQSGIITKNREIKVHNSLQELKYSQTEFIHNFSIFFRPLTQRSVAGRR